MTTTAMPRAIACPSWCQSEPGHPVADIWTATGQPMRDHFRAVGDAAGVFLYITNEELWSGDEVEITPPRLVLALDGVTTDSVDLSTEALTLVSLLVRGESMLAAIRRSESL